MRSIGTVITAGAVAPALARTRAEVVLQVLLRCLGHLLLLLGRVLFIQAV
ncbi:hypothetical protein N5K55_25370 [Pseudomonas aeruginosa]|nr:hypothetical protein [Pseudomonas aeruginosa]